MAKLQQGCAGAEQMTTQRWIGAIVGIAVFIAAFGVALAVTWYQGSQDVPAAVSVHSTVVISGDNLGLWHDSAGLRRWHPWDTWTEASAATERVLPRRGYGIH